MDLFYIMFQDGSHLVEYATDEADLKAFLNRSYSHKGIPTLIEPYNEEKHGI